MRTKTNTTCGELAVQPRDARLYHRTRQLQMQVAQSQVE